MLYILCSIFLFNLLHSVSPAALPSPFDLQKRAPSQVYGAGQLFAEAAGSPLVALDNGVEFYFQNSDSNAVLYVNGVAKWYSAVHQPAGCDNGHKCLLAFQHDGNFVSYYDGVPTWYSKTTGKGQYLAFNAWEPYIVISDASWTPIWTSGTTRKSPDIDDVYDFCDGGSRICSGPGGDDSWFSWDIPFKKD